MTALCLLAVSALVSQVGGMVPAAPSVGCVYARRTSTVTNGSAVSRSILVGNITRTYWLYVPSREDFNASRPLPLVLNFHGWKSDGQWQMTNTNGNAIANESGFIHVYPDGMDDNPTPDGTGWRSWNAGGSSLSPGPAGPICDGDHSGDGLCYSSCARRAGGCDAPGCDWTSCVDDLGFVEMLLDHLEETLCVDRNRVYATGFSNGAMLVYTLGMSLSRRFAAIAPVEGGIHPGFLVQPAVPVSLLDIHGTQDLTLPINGTDGM